LKVIEATDVIEVAQTTMVIVGPHGIGKTTLFQTAQDPLTLGFDPGYYRAGNRKRAVEISSWADVGEVTASKDLMEKTKTIGIDTGGRCLDMLSASIVDENTKNGNGDGSLSIKGWGILKNRFGSWQKRMNLLGKDIVIICHETEKSAKNGESTMYRADLQGGSYGEVMKSADFIGRIYMRGTDRVLDFNPTEEWQGKNPANWKPILIPHFSKDPNFLGNLLAEGKKALGKLSEDSAQIAGQIADWQAKIEELDSVDAINEAIPTIAPITPVILREQVKAKLHLRSKALGLTFDKAAAKYVKAEAKA
jgi:hypothetical protein